VQPPATSEVAALFARDPADSSVLVVYGYGVHLHVRHGQLVVDDGIGQHRRQRRLPRAQRTVRRIVLLGHTGALTLDAVRWCADTGIALLQIDTDGRVLLAGGNPGRTDPRLLRAQAAAAGSDVGVLIARQLLAPKLAGQAGIAETTLDQPTAGCAIRQLATDLDRAPTLTACRDLEAQAANIYFAAWTGRVTCRFTTQDQPRMPDDWATFTARRSPLHTGGRSPRSAADPINALLNYGYALAEAECRLAALAVGLDPGLGVLHTDQRNRDSLALDLLEALRPVVERHVLHLLSVRTFCLADLVETRDGGCRLLPPLTHELAEQLLPELARAVSTPAETVAHLLADSSPGKIELRTPLSRANTATAQTRGQRSAHRQPPAPATPRRTCRQCGVDLYGSARKLCPSCWPVQRQEYMRQLGKARAKPHDPEPSVEELSGGWSLQRYRQEILPGLADLPLPEIERSTGLSNATCSRLRRGLQIPNPRHWAALATLAEIARTGPSLARSAGVVSP
jgi:CRISPR-associated endonuclease Cas1